MPKYIVSKAYRSILSATVTAKDEQEAKEKFDEVATCDCTEEYKGLLEMDGAFVELVEDNNGNQ